MFNLDFKQKSPQQRFLFILGIFMIIIFLGLAISVVFFSDAIGIDPEKFPKEYRIAFAVVLMVYAGIRFGRLINQKEPN